MLADRVPSPMLMYHKAVHIPDRANPVCLMESNCTLQVTARGAGIATAAAVVANLFESYLGAASQGRLDWLSNDAVNMIQICLAAVVALLLQRL